MHRQLESATGKAVRKLIAISAEQDLNTVQQVKPGITHQAEDSTLKETEANRKKYHAERD